jgi:hypothetical protein
MKSPQELKEIKSIQTDGGYYGELRVCSSGNGFYIGRVFYDELGFNVPGSRESDYYRSKIEAQKALDENNFSRYCDENEYMYGMITSQKMEE